MWCCCVVVMCGSLMLFDVVCALSWFAVVSVLYVCCVSLLCYASCCVQLLCVLRLFASLCVC